MDQDVPKTTKETKRQKGPIPPVAIFLAIGLVVAFIAFFGPAWVSALKIDN